MAEPAPIILTNPDLTINEVSLKCLLSHIELNPDVETVEVKTACGTREYPGSVKWTLSATLYHSFDPEGTNTVLNAAVEAGVPVPFSVIPYSTKPVSETNPRFVGTVIPQPFTQLSGDIGEASSVDLEWSITDWLLVPTLETTDALTTTTTETPPEGEVVEAEPVNEADAVPATA